MEPDETIPQETTPTQKSTDPVEEIKNLYQGTLAELNRRTTEAEARNRQMEDELNKLRSINVTPRTEQNQNPSPDDFWKDPVTVMNSLIQKQIAPLQQTATQVQHQNLYNTIKNQYRNQFPGFSQIEPTVDQFMQGLEPSHANMQIAIQRAVGHIAMTNPSLLNAPAPEKEDSKVIPISSRQNDTQAHLRPTPRNVNIVDTKPQRRQLTESEKRVIKEFHGGDEESYWKFLESSSQVDSWRTKK